MLTTRQLAFVEHYLVCGNATEAARRAGYATGSAKVTASRLLANANLQTVLRARQDALGAEHRLSRACVVHEVLKAIDMARCKSDHGTMIRGLSEIARMLGFYEPERRHVRLSQGDVAIQHKLAAMSDEELLNVVSSRAQISG